MIAHLRLFGIKLTSQNHILVCVDTVLSAPSIGNVMLEDELGSNAILRSVYIPAVSRQVVLTKQCALVLGKIALAEDGCQSVDISRVSTAKQLIVGALLSALRRKGSAG
jgi:hypothetical protein